MNGVLFRRSARSLWKTWVVFAAVLSLYVSMITAMFDPKLNATLDEIVTAMPQLMNMVGMQAGSSSLGGFLINYLYGFLVQAAQGCTVTVRVRDGMSALTAAMARFPVTSIDSPRQSLEDVFLHYYGKEAQS